MALPASPVGLIPLIFGDFTMNATVISLAEEMASCTPVKPQTRRVRTVDRVPSSRFEEDVVSMTMELDELREKRKDIQIKLDQARDDAVETDAKIADVQLRLARKIEDEKKHLERTKKASWRKPFWIGLCSLPGLAIFLTIVNNLPW